MTPEIERYIRENRDRYTREAIERSLREAGHEQAAIDAAWAAVERDATPAAEAHPAEAAAEISGVVVVSPRSQRVRRVRRAQVLNDWRLWVTAVVTAVIVGGVPWALAAGLQDANAGAIFGLIAAVVVVIAAVTLLIMREARAIAFGLLGGLALLIGIFALLLVIAFIFIVIIAGICLVGGLNP
ncbi:MAG: hypothetical protein ACTHNK_06445 [Thermomicrobiales bacterium]